MPCTYNVTKEGVFPPPSSAVFSVSVSSSPPTPRVELANGAISMEAMSPSFRSPPSATRASKPHISTASTNSCASIGASVVTVAIPDARSTAARPTPTPDTPSRALVQVEVQCPQVMPSILMRVVCGPPPALPPSKTAASNPTVSTASIRSCTEADEADDVSTWAIPGSSRTFTLAPSPAAVTSAFVAVLTQCSQVMPSILRETRTISHTDQWKASGVP
mmetsp:Transcript_69700/g.194862  ORF Transcript_69700/g.194862 Transcript_69700/m.194862 type:complete len:219 (-) Transcript_69700:1-657(-)